MTRALRLVELAAIALLASFCVASSLPAFHVLGRANGTFGIGWSVQRDANGASALTVAKTDAGSPAERAGVESGDHLPASASIADRYAAIAASLPGESRTFAFVRDGAPRPATLIAATGTTYYPDDAFNRFYMAVRLPEAVLLAIVAVALVLRAPSKMTWGLALFLLSLEPGGVAIRYFVPLLDPVQGQLFGAVYGMLDVVGHVGAVVFALRFPRDDVTGWGAVVDRWAWPFAFLLTLARWAGARFGEIYFPALPFAPFVWIDRFVQLLPWIAAVILINTLLSAKGAERQRLHWVIVGVAIGCLVQPFNAFSANMSVIDSSYVARALGLLTGVVPLFVAYGVLRHRVVDVGFVLNRAAVYALVTALLVGVLAIVKILAGDYLQQNWQVVIQAATAIGLGLSTQRIYKAAEWLVDRYFFPTAHVTEERLKRLGDGLRYSRTTHAVAQALTVESSDALNLASCALFRRRADGSYVRRAAVGWDDAEVTEIAASDSLPIYLEGDDSHFEVRDVLKGRRGFPPGNAAPQHAFPLMVARDLAGFVLCSDHLDGASLDPDEITMLDTLVKAAGDAYDPLLRVKEALRGANAQTQS